MIPMRLSIYTNCPALFRKPNFALAVDVPPIKTSIVVVFGAIVPGLTDCQ